MKPGARAVGVAESYRERGAASVGDSTSANGDATAGGGDTRREVRSSTLAAVVTRVDRTVDGFEFGSCTVGGVDATDAVVDLLSRLDREDAQYVVLSGIAPAWYNVLDLPAIRDGVGRPVLSVSFESSPGLEPALREAFEGEELDARLSVYRRQPPRTRVTVNDETVFVRAVGLDGDRAREVVRAFTPAGGRPEPIRVARLAARAADRLRVDSGDETLRADS